MEQSSHATATSDQSTGNSQKPQWYTEEGAGPGLISISPQTNSKVRHSDSLGFSLPLWMYEKFLLWALEFMMQLI